LGKVECRKGYIRGSEEYGKKNKEDLGKSGEDRKKRGKERRRVMG